MRIVLAERESEVMQVLWDSGAATVSEVREKLRDALAYTTVLTILRKLEAKGYVGHEERGRAHRYSARIARDAARRSALRDLAKRLFKGSSELLLVHLVEDQGVTEPQATRIRELLEKHLRKSKL